MPALLKFLKWLAAGENKAARGLVLAIIPLLTGLLIYLQSIPGLRPPIESRNPHPPLPERYQGLVNPLRNPSDAAVERFIAENNLGQVSLTEARKLLLARYIEQGRVLFVKNCAPCHGVKADGSGPMARALRLKPTNFIDPDATAALTESYLYWRIKEGGIGLPPESTPWDSAMPPWGENLTDEEIWKIILALYEIAGVQPPHLSR